MKYNEILKKAADKANAAKTLLEGDTPDVAQATGLLDEAKALREQAEAVKRAEEMTQQFEQAKAEKPIEPAGLQIIADETDKRIAHQPPYKNLGDFLMDVVRFRDDPDVRESLRGLRSTDPMDESGFNVGKAIGFGKVGSLSDARESAQVKAISGMSELVPADGGLLVQTDVRMNILSRMYNVGQLLQRVGMIGISPNSNGLTLYGEDETSRKAGYRHGGILSYWASEGDEKTASKPKFREINFKLNKLVGLVYATDELLADASALGSYVMQRLPDELRFQAENAIIRGTGAGQPLGVLNSPARVQQAAEVGQAAATVVSENIIRMWSRRWGGSNDYVWLINQDVTPQLHMLNLPVGTGGALVYMPPGGLSQSPYGSLYGRPVLELEYCSTLGTEGDIILFSPSEYQMIDKGGVQSAVSIHVRFIYDEQVFRFVYRLDGRPLWHSALTPFQGTVTQSPIVTLATRP